MQSWGMTVMIDDVRNEHVFVGGWTFLCISTTVREVMTITGIHVYCC